MRVRRIPQGWEKKVAKRGCGRLKIREDGEIGRAGKGSEFKGREGVFNIPEECSVALAGGKEDADQ